MWIKFDKIYFSLESIPPEKSKLYSNIQLLENFDFFDCLSEEIRHFTYLGAVYICGDFKSRTGSRFVDLLDSDEHTSNSPCRRSLDSIVNTFGHKLISICKENDLKILNGCLEPGRFTFVSHTGSSVVNYFISQTRNYHKILNMDINPSEFSDHCIVEATFNAKFKIKVRTQRQLTNFHGTRPDVGIY